MSDPKALDAILDEMLVNLAGIVMRLSRPEIAATPEARQALARSVRQFAICAAHSADPRVQALKQDLEATLKPNLRVVARDGATVA